MPPKNTSAGSQGSQGKGRSRSPSKSPAKGPPKSPTTKGTRGGRNPETQTAPATTNPVTGAPVLPKPGGGRYPTRSPSPVGGPKSPDKGFDGLPKDYDNVDKIGRGKGSKSSRSSKKGSLSEKGSKTHPIDLEEEGQVLLSGASGTGKTSRGQRPPVPTADTGSDDAEGVAGPSNIPGPTLSADPDVPIDSIETDDFGFSGTAKSLNSWLERRYSPPRYPYDAYYPPTPTRRKSTSQRKDDSARSSVIDRDENYLRWRQGARYDEGTLLLFLLNGKLHGMEGWIRDWWQYFKEETRQGLQNVCQWWHAFYLSASLLLFYKVLCSPARGQFCAHQMEMGRSRFAPVLTQFKSAPLESMSLLCIYFLIICGIMDVVFGLLEMIRRVGIRRAQPVTAQTVTVPNPNMPPSAWRIIRTRDSILAKVNAPLTKLDNFMHKRLNGIWKCFKNINYDVFFVALEPVFMLLLTLGLPAWITRSGFPWPEDVFMMVCISFVAHVLKWTLLAHRRLTTPMNRLPPKVPEAWAQDSDRRVLFMLATLALPIELELLGWAFSISHEYLNALRWMKKQSLLNNSNASWRSKLSQNINKLGYTVTTKTVLRTLVPSTTGVQ